MRTENGNEPAFPVVASDGNGNMSTIGITKRELFALAFTHAAISNGKTFIRTDVLTILSVRQAEDLLK